MLAEIVRPVYASGECEIDLARRELRILGSPVPVGGRAFEVIEVLAQSAGELVTKDELMDRIWPGATVMENTLHVHAAAVRKALGQHGKLLKTESGRGYRLLGSWSVRHQETATQPVGPPHTRTSGEPPGSNFPLAVARLVGRADAVQRIQDLVSAYRVVTLTGSGGIGKTSLAVEVGRRILGEFGDGGWLVELGSVANPALVPSTVAGVLGLKIIGELSAETVARAVAGQNLLLVLDNCEHVSDAVATLAEMFVRLCPRTTILATSRETLRIQGEHVYRVPPLEVPAVDNKESGHILGHSAVELFIARAEGLDANFSSHTHDLPAIATICRRLDGIPLAIEFAAARAATLGIEHVVAGLHDRFGLLTGGRRTAMPQHRTLRATLDWSHELLADAERCVLRRLAIFAAAFPLEAAVAVTAGGSPAEVIADGVANLVAKSLLAVDHSGTIANFRLLETTRAYALEKLAESGEARQFARHHAKYYQEILRKIVDAGAAGTVDLADLGNARAALEWCFGVDGDAEIGVCLAAAATSVFLAMSLLTECHRWSERAILALDDSARGGPDELHLHATLGVSLMFMRGESEAVRRTLERSLVIAEDRGDARAQLQLLTTLHMFHGRNGDGKTSLEYAKRGSAVAGSIGDPAALAMTQSFLGLALHLNGDQGGARAELESALRHGPGSPRTGMIDYGFDGYSIAGVALARTLWLQGHPAQAVDRAHQSARDARRLDHPVTRSIVLVWAITVFLWAGDVQSAEENIDWFISRARAHSMGPYLAVGRGFKAQLAILGGNATAAVVELRDCLTELHATRYETLTIPFNIALVQGLMAINRSADGLVLTDETIGSAETNGALSYLPELLRLKGRLQSPPLGNGELSGTYFRQSIELSRRQGALAWELRAATDLASLLAHNGQSRSALALLRPVFEQFTEGLDTPDLQAAERLLSGLAGLRGE